jgi:hypothetical protein
MRLSCCRGCVPIEFVKARVWASSPIFQLQFSISDSPTVDRPIRVPCGNTGADERSPLSVPEQRRLRDFHRGLVRDTDVLCEDAVLGPAQTVVPVLDRAVERGGIKGNNDSVSSVEPRDRFADLVDLTHHVRARDNIVLDWEGVFRRRDGDICQ